MYTVGVQWICFSSLVQQTVWGWSPVPQGEVSLDEGWGDGGS